MFCPGCGAELPIRERTCPKCGHINVTQRSAGLTPNRVKMMMAALVMVLLIGAGVVGAGFAFFSTLPGGERGIRHDPRGVWAAMDFDFAGIKFDVPGDGWSLTYNASSRLIFRNDVDGVGELDIYFASIFVNPDIHRVDNRPHIFQVVSQENVELDGLYSDATVTTVEIEQDGIMFRKQQLYFRRTFIAKNSQPQTFTYLVTLTYPKGAEGYREIFQHILDSMRLYEYD